MKTAVITGASGGIGYALTKAFIKNGYFVIAQYNRGEKQIECLKEELKKDNLLDYLFAISCNLKGKDGAEKVVSAVKKSFNKIDVLINNAGIDLYKLIEETTDSELDDIVEINFKSAFNITKNLVPLLRKSQNASIINVSSCWGTNGASMESAYSATKSALIGLTKALAKELAPIIRVNCITPGVIDTPMNACFTESEMQDIISEIPLGRIGKPLEVATLCEFLASENAKYITGAIIPIDGGYSL